MKEKNKVNTISIKKFCEEYKNRVPQTQQTYLEENLGIEKYVPFLTKDVLAERIVEITMFKYENYIDEEGNTQRRKTNIVNSNSVVQYLLFCRAVIETYTNLTVETDGFYEEYDALKSCGLLDKLMVGTETTPPIIPVGEIAELRSLIEMKKTDLLSNYANPQSYIANQVERVSTILSVTLKPIMDRIATAIENMDEKDIEKLTNKVEKMMKRVK